MHPGSSVLSRAEYNENTLSIRPFVRMAEVAYCVKCKQKREMNDAKEVSFAGKGGNQRRAMQGICPVCGTKMFKILGNKK